MLTEEIEQKTSIRFQNVDFEKFINAIDKTGYDSNNVNFTGWLHILTKLEIKKVNRSQFGTEIKQDVVEGIGNKCYIPTSGNCFIKCNNSFTRKNYTQDFLIFIRTEQGRSNVMTSARIQPFCRKYIINIGFYDGYGVYPRNIAERKTAIKMHNNHFCLFWKSNGFSFNQAIEDELKPNFEVVHNVISDKHAKSYNKYESKPKEVHSRLTTVIVHDLETFNTDEAVPYANYLYRLGETSGRNNRPITERECNNCGKDCIVFNGTDSNKEEIDHVLQFKGEPKSVKKNGNHNFYI